MDLLERFRPVLVTGRVRDEFHKATPTHGRDSFRTGVRKGWIGFHRGAHERLLQRIRDEFDALSDTDAELLALAAREGIDLFTDDRDLLAACRAHGVTGLDVADTIALLVDLGRIDGPALESLVHEISKERAFTRDDLALLRLRR